MNGPGLNRAALGFGALLLLALALLPVLFVPVEEQVERGPTGQARINDWYGLQRVLADLGTPATSRYGLGPLPPADHVVLVLTEDRLARQALWPRALAWAAEGGHLVVVGVSAEEEDTGGEGEGEDVLEELGLRRFASTAAGPRLASQAGPPRTLAQVPTVALISEFGDAGAWWTESDERWALRLAHGEGWVTVLADVGPFTNAELGKADHAPLAWDLLRLDGAPPAGAVLVLAGESPGFLALAWRHAAPLLIAALALALVVGWRGAVRTGPLAPDPVPDRRDLMEHVAASGDFLWREDLHAALLAGARSAVRGRLSRHRLDAEGRPVLDDRALVDAALESGAPGVDEASVRAALIDRPPTSPAAFLAVVRTLQQLWSPR